MMSLVSIYESIFYRVQMPQIDEDGLKKLVKAVRSKKVKVKSGQYDVNELKPSQKDIDWYKVQSFIETIEKEGVDGFPPIVVSRDKYILDGHHRTVAMQHANCESLVEGYEIDADVIDAMHIFNECVEELEAL